MLIFKNEAKQLSDLNKKPSTSTTISSAQTSTDPNNKTDSTDTAKLESLKKPSMFSDIKEVLKAVEISKSQIELNLIELARDRDNKLFYNSTTLDDDESVSYQLHVLLKDLINF